LYGQPSDRPALDWAWVDSQLAAAGTYWVTARNQGHPHPRPVWGAWRSSKLYLSIGTPVTVRTLSTDPVVTVHLDSGTDVVIVEGRYTGTVTDADVIAEYDRKYDWSYEAAPSGRLTCVVPQAIVGWRRAGWGGGGSFQETGRWHLA
jgi:hypothetical protein